MKKYTVLLLVPDYFAETFGQDTYHDWVEAASPTGAVYKARDNAWDTHKCMHCNKADYYPLAVYEGWHKEITPGKFR